MPLRPLRDQSAVSVEPAPTVITDSTAVSFRIMWLTLATLVAAAYYAGQQLKEVTMRLDSFSSRMHRVECRLDPLDCESENVTTRAP